MLTGVCDAQSGADMLSTPGYPPWISVPEGLGYDWLTGMWSWGYRAAERREALRGYGVMSETVSSGILDAGFVFPLACGMIVPIVIRERTP